MSKYMVYTHILVTYDQFDEESETKVEDEVDADSCKVDGGSLIFFTNKKITTAYGPGQWRTVTKIS